MSVEKSTMRSAEICAKTEPRVSLGKKKESKSGYSTKAFSFTMQGAMAIIIVDGLSRFSEDPVWALTCIALGIPILMLGVYELFRITKTIKSR